MKELPTSGQSMDSKEAAFWSSYTAVATPNIQEEILVQHSAPSRAWFSKTDSTSVPPITRKQWLIIVLIYSGNFCAAMSFSLQAPFFPKQVAIVKPNIMLNGGFSLTCLCVVLFGLVAQIESESRHMTFVNHAPAGATFVSLAFLIRIMEGLGAAAYITASAYHYHVRVPGPHRHCPVITEDRLQRWCHHRANRWWNPFRCVLGRPGLVVKSGAPQRLMELQRKGRGVSVSELCRALPQHMRKHNWVSATATAVRGCVHVREYEVKDGRVGGFTTPFVVCGSIGFFCNAVTYIVIPSIEDKHESTPTDLRKFWSGPLIYMYAVAIFGSYVCVGFNQATLQPHLEPFKLSTTVLGLVFMIPGICNGLMTPVWGWLCDKKVNTKLLTSLGAYFTLLYLLLVGPVPFFPFETKLWLVLVSMAFFGIGIGGASICAFIATLEYTLSFTGPALGGVLLQHVGYAWGTVVLFSFQAIVAVLVTTVYLREVCCSSSTIIRSNTHGRLLDADTATNSSSCEFTTVSGRVHKAQQYGTCNGDGLS
ncbi:hypothetical protein HPB51_006785 [Rhipicephalus microplus]|uniref:Uncharacterized protein n=1 Tax=Rhipicephalus microplus TaxID=6941 RepID=A0A9J6E844_RHIMP|nr:hypothetical protein HPB51_006785 [Rhipicephalus microplus]